MQNTESQMCLQEAAPRDGPSDGPPGIIPGVVPSTSYQCQSVYPIGYDRSENTSLLLKIIYQR